VAALEKHYSVFEISDLWGLSPGVVRSLFSDRADVIRIGHGERLHKRAYITLRIPESVVQRVHAELHEMKS
jgi:hypothetical protein